MNKKVALISSKPDFLNLCKNALAGAGIDSCSFDPAQGEESLAENIALGSFLLGLCDESFGLETASSLLKKIKNKNNFFYILTVSSRKIPKEKLLSLGLSGYLPAPATPEKIKDACLRFFEILKSAGNRTEKTNENHKEDHKNLNSFLAHLSKKFPFSPEEMSKYLSLKKNNLNDLKELLKTEDAFLSSEAAAFLGLEYFEIINPDEILTGALSVKFSKANEVVAVRNVKGNFIVLTNPFNLPLLNSVQSLGLTSFKIGVAQPKTLKAVAHLLDGEVERGDEGVSLIDQKNDYLDITPGDIKSRIENTPVIYITNKIMENAIEGRASDMHFEPKETYCSLRFRVDGDLYEFTKIKKETGNMVITRMKALSGMDITERRRPQDGAFSIKYKSRKYTLRMATSSTPYGESLVCRIIDNDAKPMPLSELGMYPEQEDAMKELSRCSQGIILVAAPTGSGKTTTIYSFISNLDLDKKSLITVEDPIEYKIAKANQQQINDKAGVTFSGLLKSSVRQDPDILFLGEVRDEESAKIAFDFSSTGHVTISTVHTSNATTAIFRLERFFINRQQMAETILALISQRLIKKLCTECREKYPASPEEKELSSRFGFRLPDELYKPVGCHKCAHTGYFSRQAVYEIIKFSPEISEMVRNGKTVKEIRKKLMADGALLMPLSALKKTAEGVFDFRQIYEKILAEEIKDLEGKAPETRIQKHAPAPIPETEKTSSSSRILVVDDDRDLLELLSKILLGEGYTVDTAEDGLDAVIKISKNNYDLVLSDIDMPNLDGLKLVETVSRKNLGAKVILLTASLDEQAEEKGLKFGAADYIKKPFKKDILLLRIRKVLA